MGSINRFTDLLLRLLSFLISNLLRLLQAQIAVAVAITILFLLVLFFFLNIS
jgi:hypothetical protein